MLVFFHKVKRYIDGDMIKLFKNIQHHVNPIPMTLAKMTRSLNHFKRKGKGNFHGCTQLLIVWMPPPWAELFSIPYDQVQATRLFRWNPLQEFSVAKWPHQTPTRNQWVNYFKELREVIWKAPWMHHILILYRCGEKPWDPLIWLWEVTSYTLVMVKRQLEFSYEEKHATHKVKEVIEAWEFMQRVEVGSCNITTPSSYTLW